MTDSLKSTGTYRFPCVLAVLMISCPKQLLRYALPAYIVGLGVYLGSLWCYPPDTAAGRNDMLHEALAVYAKARTRDVAQGDQGLGGPDPREPWLRAFRRIRVLSHLSHLGQPSPVGI
jgi:hypothetical protein